MSVSTKTKQKGANRKSAKAAALATSSSSTLAQRFAFLHLVMERGWLPEVEAKQLHEKITGSASG